MPLSYFLSIIFRNSQNVCESLSTTVAIKVDISASYDVVMCEIWISLGGDLLKRTL